MSYKTQVALGKNTTLQRQLEEKYVEFRRNLKSTRRRLDMLEEECLSVLYKLIIDQSGKEDESQKNEEKKAEQKDTKDTKDPKESKDAKGQKDPKRAKSASAKLWRGQAMVDPPLKPSDTPTPPRRSTTSMSVRDYQKSYSFQVDGLNIDKNRRERYIRSKKQKEEKQVEIRRGNVHWATKDNFDEDPRPMTTLPEVEDKPEKKEEEQSRPFTADPYQPSKNKATLLRRTKLRNTLRPGTSLKNDNIENTQAQQNSEEDTTKTCVTGNQLQENGQAQTPVPTTVGRVTPQISFKVSVTKLNDMRGPTPTIPENIETPRLSSRADMTTVEDELIPLGEEDQRHLETIMADNAADDDKDSVDGTTSRLDMTSRMTSKSGKSSALSKTPSGKDGTGKEGADLVQLATRTQSFLTSYAKKSKLLGYVVKTSSSSAAPRDKNRKTYRSHCVTYQELVSIKANIKQQVSRTRLLLQRSAKLTKYVDNLANAGKVRRYLQSLKTQQ